jgi:TetR/AcrR family transcriptional repressor of bet genes
MGRPSNREARRAEILGAFARVLADHGYAGATIAAVATEAGVAPGLVHYHFDDKEDLLVSLLSDLIRRFRVRVREHEQEPDLLLAYVDGALRLDERSDITAARCWVGLFSEAIRNPTLFKRVRNLIDTEITSIQTRSGDRLDAHQAGAVLAFIIGALVLGAFAPKKTAGFAAPSLHALVQAMRQQDR